jgi:hypothetical protein
MNTTTTTTLLNGTLTILFSEIDVTKVHMMYCNIRYIICNTDRGSYFVYVYIVTQVDQVYSSTYHTVE